MLTDQGTIPPTSFTNGLTRHEVLLAHKLFRYDATTDMIRWKERTLDMFTQYRRPEYVMQGWTRGMVKAGWEVPVIKGVTPQYGDGRRGHPQWGRVDFTYRSQRHQWHMNDLYRLLVGRSMPEPIALKKAGLPSRRVDLVGDPWLIRQFIAPDRANVLRWQPVTRDVWDRLLEIRRNYGGVGAQVDPNLSHRAYATNRVGRGVTAGKDGFVRFGGQITVAWDRVCEIVGVRGVEPLRYERPTAAAPITDAMIRMLVFARYYDDVGEVRYGWKPRTENTWQMMLMCGVIDKMPTARFKASWDLRFSGRRFGEGRGRGSAEQWGDISPFSSPNRTTKYGDDYMCDATIRIGKCLVKGRRVERVLWDCHENVPEGYVYDSLYPVNRGF